jgi:hypothetical protein
LSSTFGLEMMAYPVTECHYYQFYFREGMTGRGYLLIVLLQYFWHVLYCAYCIMSLYVIL